MWGVISGEWGEGEGRKNGRGENGEMRGREGGNARKRENEKTGRVEGGQKEGIV